MFSAINRFRSGVTSRTNQQGPEQESLLPKLTLAKTTKPTYKQHGDTFIFSKGFPEERKEQIIEKAIKKAKKEVGKYAARIIQVRTFYANREEAQRDLDNLLRTHDTAQMVIKPEKDPPCIETKTIIIGRNILHVGDFAKQQEEAPDSVTLKDYFLR